MSTTNTVGIEKKNLEAHVEICAVRYNNLEHKLIQLQEKIGDVNDRMDNFEKHLLDIKNAISTKDEKRSDKAITAILGVFGIILAALIGIFANNLSN